MTLSSPGLRLNSKLYSHLETTNVLGAASDIRGIEFTKIREKSPVTVFVLSEFSDLVKMSPTSQ